MGGIIHIKVLRFARVICIGAMTKGLQSEDGNSWRINFHIFILGNHFGIFSFLFSTKLFLSLLGLLLNCWRDRIWRRKLVGSFICGLSHKLSGNWGWVDWVWLLRDIDRGWRERLRVRISIFLIILHRRVHDRRNGNLFLVFTYEQMVEVWTRNIFRRFWRCKRRNVSNWFNNFAVFHFTAIVWSFWTLFANEKLGVKKRLGMGTFNAFMIIRIVLWGLQGAGLAWDHFLFIQGPLWRANWDVVLGLACNTLEIKVLVHGTLLTFISILVVIRIVSGAFLMTDDFNLIRPASFDNIIIDQSFFTFLTSSDMWIIEVVLLTSSTLQFIWKEMLAIWASHTFLALRIKVGFSWAWNTFSFRHREETGIWAYIALHVFIV